MASEKDATPGRIPRGPGRPPAHSAAPGESGDTRRRVLQAARGLFLRRGYADVSVGEVAAAVGVTKPTLYYHFGDKEGLYAEVICDALTRVGGYVRNVTQTDAPLRQRLFDLALGYFRNASYTMEPMLRDATALLGAERSAQVWDIYEREFYAPFEALMADGARSGELRADQATRTLVHAFLGLLEALTAPGGHLARSDDEHQAAAAAVVSLFLNGAAVERARSVLSS